MSRNRITLFIVGTTFFLTFVNASASLSDGFPTAPTNIKAVAHASYQPQVVLTWNQAMDNVGITRYNIYRNGTFLFSPKGVGVTYTDYDIVPGQLYTYAVQAGDGDGNNSPQSDTIEIVANEGAISKITIAQEVTSSAETTSSVQQVTTVYDNISAQVGLVQLNHPESVGMVAYDNQLLITWKNPIGNQFKSVRVIKKESSYPISNTDGKVICDSLLVTQCVDRDVVVGKVYHYGVYAVDQSYRASQLVTVSGSLIEKKVSVTALQKSVATTASVISVVPATSSAGTSFFTKTLSVGSSGQEVLLLQKFLNNSGFLIVPSGPGSKGNETTFFGNATQKALQAYQCSKKIVCEGTPLSTGYGLVGKTTRMNLNKELKN